MAASVIVASAYSTSGNGGRKEVRLSSGALYCAVINGTTDFRIYKSTDGVSWTLFLTIAETATDVAIATNGTYLYVLNGSNTVVHFRKYNESGALQGSVINVHTSLFSTGAVSLCIDSTGAPLATWAYKTTSTSGGIGYSKSSDGGVTWLAVTSIATGSSQQPHSNPCIVVRSNNYPTIIWEQFDNPGAAFYIYSSTWNGSAWNAKVTILTANIDQRYVCAVINSDDSIDAFWYGGDATETKMNIRTARSTDGGATYSTPVKLTTGNTYDQKYPSVGLNPANNDKYLFFQGRASGTYDQIRMMKYSAGAWSAITDLTSNTTNHAQYPSVLWSKYNMNISDSVRFIYQDLQATAVKADSLAFPPSAPIYYRIASTGSTINKRPKLFFTMSVSQGDPLLDTAGNPLVNFEIQISTNGAFSNIIMDVQYANDSGYGTQTAGWSGLPAYGVNGANQTATWVPQSDLTVGTLYLRARLKEDVTNLWSAWSTTQQFTIATAPWNTGRTTITPSGNGMLAECLNDLAVVINNSRQFRGLATFSFTDGTLVAGTDDVKAIHMTERRTKLTDVLTVVGVTPTWTNTTINNTKDRDGQDIIDLRNYCTQT